MNGHSSKLRIVAVMGALLMVCEGRGQAAVPVPTEQNCCVNVGDGSSCGPTTSPTACEDNGGTVLLTPCPPADQRCPEPANCCCNDGQGGSACGPFDPFLCLFAGCVPIGDEECPAPDAPCPFPGNCCCDDGDGGSDCFPADQFFCGLFGCVPIGDQDCPADEEEPCPFPGNCCCDEEDGGSDCFPADQFTCFFNGCIPIGDDACPAGNEPCVEDPGEPIGEEPVPPGPATERVPACEIAVILETVVLHLPGNPAGVARLSIRTTIEPGGKGKFFAIDAPRSGAESEDRQLPGTVKRMRFPKSAFPMMFRIGAEVHLVDQLAGQLVALGGAFALQTQPHGKLQCPDSREFAFVDEFSIKLKTLTRGADTGATVELIYRVNVREIL